MSSAVQEAYTDWTLVSLSPLGPAALVAVVLAVVAAMVFVVWTYRSARHPSLLVATRVLGGLLVVGFLIEPALQLRVVRRVKNRVAVIVDRSRSMSLATEAGTSRYEALQAILESDKADLERLGEAHLIEWYDLDGPIPAGALTSPPTAEGSDLLQAIERARTAATGKPLAGIVLISDGADNAGMEGSARDGLSAQAAERLSRLGVPVNTVHAGGGGFRDIAIADVRADEFAFVHNTFEVEVALEASGFAGATLPVTLKRDDQVITTQTIALGEDGSAHLVVKSKPDKIGEFVYSVSIPVLSGEAIAENNERSFVLSVIRDKIRVLQVAGRPSWDERFLRQHLKENPNVDLISFFILRTPTDRSGAPDGELSLIPFPVEKLFTTELRSFDVVVFQNFDYRSYNMAQYLGNIRDAVRDGGLGFVMIGGSDSFGDHYASTEIAAILPFSMERSVLATAPVVPVLTPAGRLHPVTDLTRGAASNDAAWTQLGSFTSVNVTAGLSPGATTLVNARRANLAGDTVPLVAVTDAGLGRSMAVATDSMWRWRFAMTPDRAASERAYHRFWSNALRWLVRDPEHSRVRVKPARRRFELGAPAEVGFSVLGRDYQPLAAATLRVTLSQMDAGALRRNDLTTGEGGVAQLRYDGLPAAAYRVHAGAWAAGERLGDGEGVFIVDARSIELTRGAPRPDLLEAIAAHTGGATVKLEPGLWRALNLTDPEVIDIDKRRNVELWDNAWALVAGILILAADWALRRRRGYL